MSSQARPRAPSTPLLVAIFGPTASGKTRLSLDLGERIRSAFGQEPVVISADSRQVYRYMDIGTDKVTPEKMRGIRHELLDVVDPVRKFELSDYLHIARERIQDCFRAGEFPIVVGGTGIYVSGLLDEWDVDAGATTRLALRRDFPRSMTEDAYRTLRRLDRAAADRVHPNNYEVIINALATAMAGSGSARPGTSGRSGPTTGSAPNASPFTRLALGLDPGQAMADRAVPRRHDEHMRRGLLDEICGLAERYHIDREARRPRPSDNPVLQTISYREFFEIAVARGKNVAHLDSDDLALVRAEVIRNNITYARRQRAWLRKLPDVHMVGGAARAFSLAAARYPARR